MKATKNEVTMTHDEFKELVELLCELINTVSEIFDIKRKLEELENKSMKLKFNTFSFNKKQSEAILERMSRTYNKYVTGDTMKYSSINDYDLWVLKIMKGIKIIDNTYDDVYVTYTKL